MQKVMVALPEVLVRIRNSCVSFFKENFNTNSVILAIFFAMPIYFNYIFLYYEIEINYIVKILFTVMMFISFFYMFNIKHNWFLSGFLTGVLWFWWIGLSFRFYNLSWMIPVADILIALFYGIVFWLIGKIFQYIQAKNKTLSKLFLVLFFTFAFDYISPFTFDWLKPEILFVNSIFDVSKTVLFLVFFSIAFFRELKWWILILLVIAIFVKPHNIKMPKLNIYAAFTTVSQNKKWQKKYIPYEINNNFRIIDKAISLHKDVVVLPESAFPLFLNRYHSLMKKLKDLSNKITVITGALHLKNGKFYNSTYIFENGRVRIIDKHILVPFGEYIPVPFFQKEINQFFFGGASDYKTSPSFGTFSIKNYKFINAICYEATVEDLYKLSPRYVIALSNDAWFMPSIMPSLQEMIIKVYVRKYNKIVYHSINGFKSYTVY